MQLYRNASQGLLQMLAERRSSLPSGTENHAVLYTDLQQGWSVRCLVTSWLYTGFATRF